MKPIATSGVTIGGFGKVLPDGIVAGGGPDETEKLVPTNGIVAGAGTDGFERAVGEPKGLPTFTGEPGCTVCTGD